ncbi:antibiotic biosynthesis monooxygenase family protein [Lunatibacter salilacus]|uniref:antibiotic biosynthesis monooxygenase family protein n=1 Tax=Lunatibacter salilacus TaxID=2483804 RepID=UPI00131C3F5B|nr:antibiotic biosynthesis monooxygenase family protein [Lunatibacter salilacus]
MVAWVSKFKVENGMEEEVKKAFKTRPGFVESAKGFVRLDVLSPINNPAEIHLITYWESDEDFEFWHRNHLKESHKNIPKGLKLIPRSWELTKYEYISS